MRRSPLRHVTFTLGAAITVLLLATAALSLVYTPDDPLAMSITGRLQGPSSAHPFGTDQYGRDVLSRVMRGTLTSIAVGVQLWTAPVTVPPVVDVKFTVPPTPKPSPRSVIVAPGQAFGGEMLVSSQRSPLG